MWPRLIRCQPRSAAPVHCVRRFSNATSAPSLPSASAFRHALTSSPNASTPSPVTHLQRHGFAVIDGLFGASRIADYRTEIRRLVDAEIMIPNTTRFALPQASGASDANAYRVLAKRSVHEMEIPYPGLAEIVPHLHHLSVDSTLRDELSAALAPASQLDIRSHAVKVQHSTGGGCFPMHADADAAIHPDTDTRVITAIVYLNHDWTPQAGGELKLYPVPLQSSVRSYTPSAPGVEFSGSTVTIQPRADRVVLFSSLNTVHRVLPVANDYHRYCLTVWLSGRRRAGGGNARPPHADPKRAKFERLCSPLHRTHFVRALYASEWEQSLIDSHPPSAELDAALAKHRADVATIRRMYASVWTWEYGVIASGSNPFSDSLQRSIEECRVDWL